MKKILIVFLFLIIFVNNVHGEEILSVDYDRSKVFDIDQGRQEFFLKDFVKSELRLVEGHDIEAHIFIKKNPASNPPASYVLEMRTDLLSVEWQYNIPGKKPQIFQTVKQLVWESSDHFASDFEVVIKGKVPKPEVPIKEPNYEDYTGKGPGLRDSELVVFTIYDGQVDPSKIVDKFGNYNFFATNLKINENLNEINKNLATSNLSKEYAASLEKQKEYISKLSLNGHVGIALDMSKNFQNLLIEIKSYSPPDNKKILIIGGVFVFLAFIIGFFLGYKTGG